MPRRKFSRLKLAIAPSVICCPKIRLPAKTGVQRHAFGGAPRVLRVPALVQLVEVHAEVRAVLEDRHAAEQEVRQAQAGDAAVELPVAAAVRPCLLQRVPVRDVHAERDLMTPAHQRQVVADLLRLVVGDAARGGGRGDVEPAGHDHDHLVRRRIVVDARRRDRPARRTASLKRSTIVWL